MKKTNTAAGTSVLNNPQNIVSLVCVLIVLALSFISYQVSGWQYVILLWIGFFLGFSLFHARFGFSAVYRQIIEKGNTEMLRAHMLMLILVSTFSAAIFIISPALFGTVPIPALSAVSIGLIAGAFIFGFGMEIGSGLAPSSFYEAEGGRTALICTLAGFTAGAVGGAAHFGFWNTSLPSFDPVSLAVDTGIGYIWAWVIQMVFLGLVAFGSYVHKKRTRPPALPPLPSAASWSRIIFGSWPLWVGAVILAVLNALIFLVQGEPWKLTASFSLWGSKIAMALGMDVSGWTYWFEQGQFVALHQSVLMDSMSIINFGVISGTVVTLAMNRQLRFSGIPLRVALIALIGGGLMGYGASISFGANIGAYFSGIASFSLHAWIWLVMAVLGVYTAYYLSSQLPLYRYREGRRADK
ncbi:YeeE/YedE family protein [uncultured Marinococcus sp.]|uniref:YeeE/YedE family protein n=1 Tax=uncultured Marinococcus sp. TaxID=487012 RepID=UPI00262A0E65|nr:YeeE/YedE family protein [uncultured Marinococcus sp.]